MSRLPKDETQFREWLHRESERLRKREEQAKFDPVADAMIGRAAPDDSVTHAELDETDFEDAAATVREAGEIALRLHLPDAYRVVSSVRHGPLSIDLARLILSEVVRAIPETDSVSHPPSSYDIGREEGPLTVLQAANRLGVSKEKVYGLCREGAIPHERIGNRIVITLEQLATFQETNQSPAAKIPRFRYL